MLGHLLTREGMVDFLGESKGYLKDTWRYGGLWGSVATITGWGYSPLSKYPLTTLSSSTEDLSVESHVSTFSALHLAQLSSSRTSLLPCLNSIYLWLLVLSLNSPPFGKPFLIPRFRFSWTPGPHLLALTRAVIVWLLVGHSKEPLFLARCETL